MVREVDEMALMRGKEKKKKGKKKGSRKEKGNFRDRVVRIYSQPIIFMDKPFHVWSLQIGVRERSLISPAN